MTSIALISTLLTLFGGPIQESAGLKLYRDLGLPLAPAGSVLVRPKDNYLMMSAGTNVQVMWRIPAENGFIFMGGSTISRPGDERHRQKFPDPAIPISEDECLKFDFVVCYANDEFDANTTIGMALQAEALGMRRLSEKMLKAGEYGALRAFELKDASIETQVYDIAFRQTLTEFLKPKPNRKALTAKLQSFASHLPKREFGFHTYALKGQIAALRPFSSAKGSTAEVIDRLVDRSDLNEGFGSENVTGGKLDSILAIGLKAAPDLVAHLEDDRATLTYCPAMGNGWAHFETVGGACTQIVAQLMTGRFVNRGYIYPDQDPKKWMKSIQKLDERTYLESVLFPSVEEVRESSNFFGAIPINDIAFRMLKLRHPNSIPDLYKKCLARTKMMSQPIAEALFYSNLGVAKKIELFNLGINSKGAEHRQWALEYLRKLQGGRIATELVKALNAEKPFGESSYWQSPASQLAREVIRSGSPEALDALIKAMKATELGYRLEALSAVRNANFEKMNLDNKKFCLKLLEPFINDVETYDPRLHWPMKPHDDESEMDKWFGPGAVGGYVSPISCRDYTYLCIASLIGSDEVEGTKWTAEDWARFRDRVQMQLNAWKIKNGI